MQRSHGSNLPASPIGPVLLRLRLIGQMEAWTASKDSMLPTGRKTRALLAIIALFAPRPVLRGRMAEMLWSRRPEEQARASLRQEIHRLHDALDPLGPQVLAITRDHLALRPGTVWIDVEELLRATPARPHALGLYDGELLEGLDGIDPAFDGWLNGERQRLGDRARTVAETMLREQHEPDQMIAFAEQVLRIDRSHEGAWRALMRAHLARGERGMAIQAFERCRSVLAEQLDAQPSAETLRLLADVRTAMPPRVGGSGPVANGHMPNEPGAGGTSLADRSSGRPTNRPARATSYAPDPAEVPAAAGLSRTEPESPPAGAARSIPLQPGSPHQGSSYQGSGHPVSGHQGSGPHNSGQPGSAQQGEESGRRHGGERESPRPAARSAMPRGGARVGVMPLRMIGTAASEAHLANGLADEIASNLARFRWMHLPTSASVARVAAQSADEAALREALGLDFLVDGTVQRGGERLRVSMRLLDLRGGAQQVWSNRFDGSIHDLLGLQDEVAAQAAAQIEPQVLHVEAQHAADRPRRERSPYELMMRALALLPRLEKPHFMQAGELLQEASLLQPDCAAILAWQAWWQVFLVTQGWAEDFEPEIAEASRLADRAIALDPQDARVLAIAGHVRACLQRRPREGIALQDRALGLNPHLAMAWSLSGVAHACLGELDEAERRIARAKHLSPMGPHAFFADSTPVLLSLLRHDHRAAADLGRDMAVLHPSFGLVLKPYLSALGHLRLLADAAPVRARLLEIEPGFNVARYLASSALSRPEDRAHYAEGLELAGVAP